mgnify:CR=1 FL=1
MGNWFVIPYCNDKNYKEDDVIIEIENREDVINFLNEKYRDNELCILSQPPLGNCLFESLTCPFKNDGKNHMIMRKELVDYIGNNTDLIKDYLSIDKNSSDNIQLVRHLMTIYDTDNLDIIIENFDGLELEEKVNIYKQVMGKSTVYGTNLEIFAFAQKYSINVVVIRENLLSIDSTNLITGNGQYNIIPSAEKISSRYIFLLYRNENHYDVIKFQRSKSLSPSQVPEGHSSWKFDDEKISITGKSNGMMKFVLPFVFAVLFGTGTVFAINNYHQESDNKNINYEPSTSVLQETDKKEETTDETIEETMTETRIQSKDNYDNFFIIVLIVGLLFYFYPMNKKKIIKNKLT